jgi:hypothetical protein
LIAGIMAMRHDPGGTSNLMIDLWGRGGDLSGGWGVGRGGTPTLAEPAGQLADPAAFGALVDLGGISGFDALDLLSVGRPTWRYFQDRGVC